MGVSGRWLHECGLILLLVAVLVSSQDAEEEMMVMESEPATPAEQQMMTMSMAGARDDENKELEALYMVVMMLKAFFEIAGVVLGPIFKMKTLALGVVNTFISLGKLIVDIKALKAKGGSLLPPGLPGLLPPGLLPPGLLPDLSPTTPLPPPRWRR